MRPMRGRRAVSLGELKFLDTELDDPIIAAVGTITASINLIPQGVTESERVGRKCTLRSISWRYNLNFVSAANMATTSDTVRLIVYLDKQANGATIVATDLLETDNYQAYNNLSNTGRFRILFDKYHSLHAPTAIAGPVSGETDREGSFHKQLNIPVEFSAATGAIAEIRSNNIGVLVIARVGVNVKLDSKFRIRFSDG